jgi:PAS domain S-box-containing protein
MDVSMAPIDGILATRLIVQMSRAAEDRHPLTHYDDTRLRKAAEESGAGGAARNPVGGAAGFNSCSVLHSQEMSGNEIDAWLAAAADSSDDAIMTKTLDGVIRSWNRGAERLFGYTAGEAVGQPIFLIIPADRIAEEHEVLARLRRGERIDHFETIRQAKDGRRIPISLTVSPVRDDQGNLIGASKSRATSGCGYSATSFARGSPRSSSRPTTPSSPRRSTADYSWNEGASGCSGYTARRPSGSPIFSSFRRSQGRRRGRVVAAAAGERIKHFETIRQTKDGRQCQCPSAYLPSATNRAASSAPRRSRDVSDRVERERVVDAPSSPREDERARMARELHDELGQQMTALRLTLETLKAATLDRGDLRAQIDMLQEMARQLDVDVAFRVRGLRSAILETRGLAAALREYVGNWSQHSRVPLRLHTNARRRRARAESKGDVPRQREALATCSSTRAQQVDLALERHADHVSLIIEDDGVGFDASTPADDGHGAGGFGLVGMRERAALIGADLQIESTVGRGTTIFVRVPVADSPRADVGKPPASSWPTTRDCASRTQAAD